MESKELDFIDTNAFVSANDLVDGLCIREDDFDKKKKAKYLFFLREIYNELNLSVIRSTNRVLLVVSPQKFVDMPSDYLRFSSIDTPDKHGKFRPMIINKNIPLDTVDLGASKKCGCDCGCDNTYCSDIRYYELVSTTVMATMPDNSVQAFTATERKKVLKDGRYVREITTPVQQFQNNVLIATSLQTTEEFLCNLEVKECGCIKNSPKNEQLLFQYCDSYTIANDCGCAPVREIHKVDLSYNISEKGRRIQLPYNFPYDTVRVRYYADFKTKDLRIPFLAQKAVRFGIKAEQSTFDAPGSKENLFWTAKYAAAVETLAGDIVNLTLTDFYTQVLGIYNVV